VIEVLVQDMRDILLRGAEQIGVPLPLPVVESFLFYMGELKQWNERINLTAVTGDREIVAKHFLDSLTVAPYLRGVKTVLDIGTGAGFPGVPLKILSPAIELCLLESSQKKCFFLRHIVRGLKLEGVTICHGRAEDKKIQEQYAARFDLVLSRAVADLPASLQLALPYAKEGGYIVGMRGKRGEEEHREMDWASLGMRVIEIRKMTLPFVEENRVLLLLQRLET
jgi:16S rRNA (guanine527-N7)-methyltransferase